MSRAASDNIYDTMRGHITLELAMHLGMKIVLICKHKNVIFYCMFKLSDRHEGNDPYSSIKSVV